MDTSMGPLVSGEVSATGKKLALPPPGDDPAARGVGRKVLSPVGESAILRLNRQARLATIEDLA